MTSIDYNQIPKRLVRIFSLANTYRVEECKKALQGQSLLVHERFWYNYFGCLASIDLLNFDDATFFCKECEIEANSVDSDDLRAWWLGLAGFMTFSHFNSKESLELMDKSINISRIRNNRRALAEVLVFKSTYNVFNGDATSAIKTGLEALTIVEEYEDLKLQGKVHDILGNAFHYMGLYNESIEHYSIAINLYKKIGSFYGGILSNLGNVYSAQSDIPKAITCYTEALVIVRKSKVTRFEVVILNNLAGACLQLKNYQEALEWGTLALTISLNLNTNVGMSYSKIGQALLGMDRVNEALTNLNKALEDKSGLHHQNLIKLHNTLSHVYEIKGVYKKALEHKENERKIEGDLAKDTEDGIEIYKNKLAEETEKQNNEIILLKEQQLASQAILLASQSELLGNFRNELRQIVREINEPLEALKKIKERLKTLPCEEIDWLKFEGQFTSVHPEFKAKLVEKFPELTPQEIRVCLLLRVGMKSYEIGRIICVSERGVENHRFNIRKKLGLKTEQSLTEFLQAIK